MNPSTLLPTPLAPLQGLSTHWDFRKSSMSLAEAPSIRFLTCTVLFVQFGRNSLQELYTFWILQKVSQKVLRCFQWSHLTRRRLVSGSI